MTPNNALETNRQVAGAPSPAAQGGRYTPTYLT
jgi:hypothetical protein